MNTPAKHPSNRNHTRQQPTLRKQPAVECSQYIMNTCARVYFHNKSAALNHYANLLPELTQNYESPESYLIKKLLTNPHTRTIHQANTASQRWVEGFGIFKEAPNGWVLTGEHAFGILISFPRYIVPEGITREASIAQLRKNLTEAQITTTA